MRSSIGIGKKRDVGKFKGAGETKCSGEGGGREKEMWRAVMEGDRGS